MKIVFTVSAALAFSIPAAAMADSLEVEYSDLNLAISSHQAELERRIKFAADEVCQVNVHPGSMFASPKQRECARVAAANTRAQVAAAINAVTSSRFAVSDEAKQ